MKNNKSIINLSKIIREVQQNFRSTSKQRKRGMYTEGIIMFEQPTNLKVIIKHDNLSVHFFNSVVCVQFSQYRDLFVECTIQKKKLLILCNCKRFEIIKV